jgi:hypothetical protein
VAAILDELAAMLDELGASIDDETQAVYGRATASTATIATATPGGRP